MSTDRAAIVARQYDWLGCESGQRACVHIARQDSYKVPAGTDRHRQKDILWIYIQEDDGIYGGSEVG